jgi:hypothetical protein
MSEIKCSGCGGERNGNGSFAHDSGCRYGDPFSQAVTKQGTSSTGPRPSQSFGLTPEAADLRERKYVDVKLTCHDWADDPTSAMAGFVNDTPMGEPVLFWMSLAREAKYARFNLCKAGSVDERRREQAALFEVEEFAELEVRRFRVLADLSDVLQRVGPAGVDISEAERAFKSMGARR